MIKTYSILTFLLILSFNNVSSQKLHKHFERGKYGKISEIIQKGKINSVSNVLDIRACSAFSFFIGDYKMSKMLLEKAFDIDHTLFQEQDYTNYAYSLLLLGYREDILNSEILSGKEEKYYWVSYVKNMIKNEEGIPKAPGKSYDRKEIHPKDFIPQYGVNYSGENLFYSSSQVNNSSDSQLFEHLVLMSRKGELTKIKLASYRDEKKDIGSLPFKNKFPKSKRIATYSFDSEFDSEFFTIVPLNGKPEKILIKGKLKRFPFNSKRYACAMPYYDEQNKRLYFCSDMPGGIGGWDIYYTQWETNKWSQPVNLGNRINTPMDETFPSVFYGDLYFSSNGHNGLGGVDNYFFDENRDKITNLQEFNTPGDDYCLRILSGEGMESVVSVCDSILVYFKLREITNNGTQEGAIEPKETEQKANPNFITNVKPTVDYVEPADKRYEELAAGPHHVKDNRTKSSFRIDDYILSYTKGLKDLPPSERDKLDSISSYVKNNGLNIAINVFSGGGNSIRNNYFLYKRANYIFNYFKSRRIPESNLAIFIITYPTTITGTSSDIENKIQLKVSNQQMPYQINYPLKIGSGNSLHDVLNEYNNDLNDFQSVNEFRGKDLNDDYVFVGIQGLHQVKRGENLYRIALNHACRHWKIQEINKKKNHIVLVGEILLIPFCK